MWHLIAGMRFYPTTCGFGFLGPVALWKRFGLSSERSRDRSLGLACVLCVFTSVRVVLHTTTPDVEYSGMEAPNLTGGEFSRAGLVVV